MNSIGKQEFCSPDSKKMEVRMARFLLSGKIKKGGIKNVG